VGVGAGSAVGSVDRVDRIIQPHPKRETRPACRSFMPVMNE